MSNNECPFGSHLQKYWDRRYFFFSKHDEGIELDEEGLYSVKPEEEMLKVANEVNSAVILDAFCGLGGASIAFARCGKKVITYDTSLERLAMAKNNAEVYGVKDKIEFIHGDVLEDIESIDAGAIYLDPPWGGPDYINNGFTLSSFLPDGNILLGKGLNKYAEVSISVPIHFHIEDVIKIGRNFKVVYAYYKSEIIYYTIMFK